MIINIVTLNNYGIYYGRHVFDFSKNSDGNIVLIKAKNGSGKTTLLSGIKVGLYGPLTMGHRHLGQRYQAYLRERFNSQALMGGENEASITIDFSLGVNGIFENIILQRSYFLHTHQVTEKLHIEREGKVLSPSEVARFENELRQFWPPTLFDFFLFDGEQIHHQLEEGTLLRNMKEAFYSLFNLDLVGNLHKDLRSYIQQDQMFKKLDREEQKLRELLHLQVNFQNLLAQQSMMLDKYDKEIFDLREKTRQLEQEFRVNGGLAAEERDKARHKVAIMEQRKREELEWLKETIADLLPFFIAKDLLIRANDQVRIEARSRTLDVFATSHFQELADSYWQVIGNQQLSIIGADQTDCAHALLDSLKQGLMNRRSDHYIHDLNEAERAQLYLLTQEVESFDAERINGAIKNIARYNTRILTLHKTIEMNKESNELNSLLQHINQNNGRIGELSLLRQQLMEKHEQDQMEEAQCNNSMEKLQDLIKQTANPNNIVSLVLKVDHVLEDFQQIVVKDKTEKLRQNFLFCLNRIMHKDSFIRDVRFRFKDSNFMIEMEDGFGTTISYNRLSAGEKQVFLLSLTWSLIKTSERQVPIFLDTLLGRLDQDHRENIIHGFLPYVSDQVVILSTDTEIDSYYYKLVKPHLDREYTLKLDTGGHTVRITQEEFEERRPVSHAI